MLEKHGSTKSNVSSRVDYRVESSGIGPYQPDSKSNPNPNPSPNPTTKEHAIVNIQLNIVTCPMYPDKFIRDMLLHRLCDFRL